MIGTLNQTLISLFSKVSIVLSNKQYHDPQNKKVKGKTIRGGVSKV